jgi:hypothetical protein
MIRHGWLAAGECEEDKTQGALLGEDQLAHRGDAQVRGIVFKRAAAGAADRSAM